MIYSKKNLNMILLTKKYGYMQFHQYLKNLLNYIKGKSSNLPYDTDIIHSTGDEIAITDGRRLMVIKFKIPIGNYHLTSDGFLLPLSTSDGVKFPDYKKLLEVQDINKMIFSGFCNDEYGYKIIYHLARANHHVNLQWIVKLVDYLRMLNCTKVDVYVNEIAAKEEGDQPIKIIGKIGSAEFEYFQMPLRKN